MAKDNNPSNRKPRRAKPSVRSIEERNALVEQWSNLPAFVVSRLKHIPTMRKWDLDDAISVGFLGLLRAAELWDPKRNIQFSTYAFWAIRNRVVREAELASQQRDRFQPFSSITHFNWDNCPYLHLEEPKDKYEDLDDVKEECAKLPEPYKQIFTRNVVEGETLRFIAKEFGISCERVRQLRNEALVRLRRRLLDSPHKEESKDDD